MQPVVAEVRPDSPAAAAGFMPGDRFVSVDGNVVETFADLQRFVQGRAGDELVFVVLRDGQEVTLKAVPELMEQEDALGNKVKVAAIGVINNRELGEPRLITYTPAGAFVEAVRETGHVVERTGQFLKRFVVGREDRCQLGGPVKIADMAGRAAKLGFEWLVQLVALLSVGIGILNLLASCLRALHGCALQDRYVPGSRLHGLRLLERFVRLLKGQGIPSHGSGC
jgi:regulator of sigma E protease